MELANITDEGVAEIKLLGACSDCSMSLMTLKAGVEQAVKKVARKSFPVVAYEVAEETSK